ncbi:sporulation integral membrane protein YlbJ [Paenibacillus sp. J31TS4]|uniref:hypothetical protein n=1 Tax=Paenibacillus sp. J31TS4 TaxID=2807195 RepID=UPI001B208315|nr:hypothetical protein [Paenibacillus sp. J31TS4]GIP36755.1 sporulation integral membrane protein YlbJ [Paenibacillus sp. J31TS4]
MASSPSSGKTDSRLFTLLLGLLAAVLVVFLIVYPDQAFQSSLQGLGIWWDLVFPGLLPFLILSELLIGLGVVHGLGVVLEPLLRLVFRLPGAGGWALAMGLTAGYPAGAKVTSQLRSERLLGQGEAERLLALSHLGNPMLLIAVVGVGFLHSAQTGFLLAVVHYTAAMLTGLALRLRPDGAGAPADAGTGGAPGEAARPGEAPSPGRSPGRRPASLPVRAARAMRAAQRDDGRAFGKLLGDAVAGSVQALMAVGGFMIAFAVLNRVVLQLAGAWLPARLAALASPALLEPHLGAYAASGAPGGPALQAALAGAVLGWSGLSVHAQAYSLARSAGLRYGPFLAARVLHAALAFGLTLALWKPLGSLFFGAAPGFLPAAAPAGSVSGTPELWTLALWLYAVLASLFVLLAAGLSILARLRKPRTR